jgi:hypothetical protein
MRLTGTVADTDKLNEMTFVACHHTGVLQVRFACAAL